MRRLIRTIQIQLLFIKRWKLKLQYDPGVEAAFRDIDDKAFINKYYEMSLASALAVSSRCNKVLALSYSLAAPLFLSFYGVVSFDNIFGIEITNPFYLYIITPFIIAGLFFYYSILMVKREFIFSRINTALNHINNSLTSSDIYSHFIENGPYGLSVMLKNFNSSFFVFIITSIINMFATTIIVLPAFSSLYILVCGQRNTIDNSTQWLFMLVIIIIIISLASNAFYSLFVGINYIHHNGFRGMLRALVSTYKDAARDIDSHVE